MKAFAASLSLEYFKWLQSLRTALTKNLYYKINFLLAMVIPVLVFFLIKYNLWISIYEANSAAEIQGYSLRQMIHYQFWILIFDMFLRSHFFSQNISSDIRLGRISSFLLYPFNFINYQLSLFASDKILQIFIGLFSFSAAVFFGWIDLPSAAALMKGAAFILAGAAFWFFTQLIIGFASFWLDETWSLNVSVRFIAAFFSGSIIPLEMFPDAMEKILLWTPFPYLIYIPIKFLMGAPPRAEVPLLILLLWLAVLWLLAHWVWRKGLRLYTGAGI